ncbi:MAG: DNA polymerase III subunit delta [Candidatus Peribacteraceae bacterium]|nr:DNA polymerase III subunit delta [Candidatus Peribacteraceae bacterium]
MGSVFLFTGENTFALRAEFQRWVGEFREKHGEENLSRLEGSALKLGELLGEVSAAPFIAEKRLVVVEGIPSFSKEEIQRILAEVHPQVILLFMDSKPDKRFSSTKELLATATVKEFAPLAGVHLQQWLRTYIQEYGSSAADPVLAHLIDVVGTDQQQLSQEVRKLALHAAGRPIAREDVDQLVIPSAEQTVWRLMDLLGEGRAEEAVSFARNLLDRGESPYSLWNMLLWMLTNLTQVAAALDAKITAPLAIVQATGIKFGTVRSLLPLARRCQVGKLKDILSQVVEADIGLKTGAYRATAENEEELEALIDRCLLAFA